MRREEYRIDSVAKRKKRGDRDRGIISEQEKVHLAGKVRSGHVKAPLRLETLIKARIVLSRVSLRCYDAPRTCGACRAIGQFN